jgi:hypothetical protein
MEPAIKKITLISEEHERIGKLIVDSAFIIHKTL